MRRVAENEGMGEFRRFLNIACGSASELEYHFLFARDLAFLRAGDYQKLNHRAVDYQKPSHGAVEAKRMVASLVRKVQAERLAG